MSTACFLVRDFVNTMDQAKALKKRLVSTFTRKGRDGKYTGLFENLDQQMQEFLIKKTLLEEHEYPVIGSVESEDKWVLITTERVIWGSGDRTQSIPVSEIAEVSADFNSLLLAHHTKMQLDELQIGTSKRERYTLVVEKGSPLIGVWNVLKQFSRRNKLAADRFR